MVEEDGSVVKRTFKHIPSSVGAFEAEEVLAIVLLLELV
jgi:hypothetical protein